MNWMSLSKQRLTHILLDHAIITPAIILCEWWFPLPRHQVVIIVVLLIVHHPGSLARHDHDTNGPSSVLCVCVCVPGNQTEPKTLEQQQQ
jgi:hypothetical protein